MTNTRIPEVSPTSPSDPHAGYRLASHWLSDATIAWVLQWAVEYWTAHFGVYRPVPYLAYFATVVMLAPPDGGWRQRATALLVDSAFALTWLVSWWMR